MPLIFIITSHYLRFIFHQKCQRQRKISLLLVFTCCCCFFLLVLSFCVVNHFPFRLSCQRQARFRYWLQKISAEKQEDPTHRLLHGLQKWPRNILRFKSKDKKEAQVNLGWSHCMNQLRQCMYSLRKKAKLYRCKHATEIPASGSFASLLL